MKNFFASFSEKSMECFTKVNIRWAKRRHCVIAIALPPLKGEGALQGKPLFPQQNPKPHDEIIFQLGEGADV